MTSEVLVAIAMTIIIIFAVRQVSSNNKAKYKTEYDSVEEMICVVIRKEVEDVKVGPFGPTFKQYVVIFQDLNAQEIKVSIKNRRNYDGLEVGKKGLLKKVRDDFIEFK